MTTKEDDITYLEEEKALHEKTHYVFKFGKSLMYIPKITEEEPIGEIENNEMKTSTENK